MLGRKENGMRRGASTLVAFFCVLAVAASFIAGCGKKAPEIMSISPITGEVGAEVVITGANFGETQEVGNGVVDFAGKTAEIKSWSDGSLAFVVPPESDPGEYQVIVRTDSGESRPTYFGVKEAEKKEETKTEQPEAAEQPETELQAVQAYMKDKNISDEGVGGQLQVTLYKTSEADPAWKLYQMPMGQGVDVTYFLVHQTDGRWEVVANWMGEGSAANYGGPADLTAPAEEG